VGQIQRIHEEGVQVEWREFDSFLEWQLHVEGASVQASVQVSSHVLDTSLKYLQFLRSPLASLQDQNEVKTSKQLDDVFAALSQGKAGIHRLPDAKTLLNTTEPSVLVSLAQGRKKVHYLYANRLAQVYFLSVIEWNQLRGKTLRLGTEEHKLQEVVVVS